MSGFGMGKSRCAGVILLMVTIDWLKKTRISERFALLLLM